MIIKTEKEIELHKKKINILKLQDTSILIVVLFFIIIIFSVINERFSSYNNILFLLKNLVVIGFLSIGLTPLLIVKEIDLSFGSNLSLTSIIIAILYNNGINIFLSILLGIVFATTIGFINGVIIKHLNLQPLVYTIGMMFVLQSVALIIAGGSGGVSPGESMGVFSDELYWFANNNFLKIPIPFIIFGIFVILVWIVLKYTRVGRHIYAIGGSHSVAHYFGIKVKKINILLYAFTGFTTGIAAVIATSITGIAFPYTGSNLFLPAAAAIFLGGLGLAGGKGNILNTLLGILIMAVTVNGLLISNVPSFYVRSSQGIILIIAVAAYEIRNRKKSLRAKY